MSAGDRAAPGTVSVLVCTAGRPAMLDRALGHLAGGRERPDQLVVVNGGDDQANDVVARHASRFDEVVLLQYGNRNVSASRNLGLPICTGDLVALTDDDAIVSADWIEQVRAVHRADPGAGAVGGPVYGARGDRFISRVADRVVFPWFSERRTVRTLPGVNVAYKRACIDAVGLFDESLFRGEDVDYNWRVMQSGYRILYDPRITVEHEHRTTALGLLQQQWMYGRAYVLVRRKWPAMYCVYPHRLRSLRDWAKVVHVVLAVLYQPALAARAMPDVREAAAAYPFLVAHHAIWKLGMLRQAIAPRLPAATAEEEGASGEMPVLLVRRWRAGEAVEERLAG